MIAGEIFPADEDIIANVGRKTVELEITNTGDRPVQVGSHYHFYEVNTALEFDRQAAYGMRLNIASGTTVRFEPGDIKTISLTEIKGTRTIYGFNNLVNGALDKE